MKTAFVICSRSDSSRVPGKPHRHINGKTLLQHLIERCLKSGYPVIVAIPHRDYEDYKYLKELYKNDVHVAFGNANDPLERTRQMCDEFELDTVIRVTHDKVFVDPVAVKILMDHYGKGGLDYVYSGTFIDGASFEVISAQSIRDASAKFKNVEFISYAVRCVTDRIKAVDLSKVFKSDHRLLVDYPEDLKVLELIFHSLGNDCSLNEAVTFLDQHQWISRINRTPKITVYTCIYNAEKWLYKAMGSVSSQNIFGECEYLLVDDCSHDQSAILMSKFASIYKNSQWFKNPKNVGLASSSNFALTRARGRYIIRLDADDFFTDDHALERLYMEAEKTGADVVYPANFFGSYKKIQKGNEKHHVGGALFRTRAANYIKFTDGLRNLEGLDFFVRAKDQLKVAYLDKPIFYYRQHDTSMSKTNLVERAAIQERIENGLPALQK
jgi:spore coat polysaccharide biosynthesis protein SpsF (cytidylyltransferase family)